MLDSFVAQGGLKMLAVSRLSAASYGLVCYLLNCHAAGMEHVVMGVGELALLLGLQAKTVKSALLELQGCHILKDPQTQGKSLHLRLELDPERWTNLRKPQERKQRPLGALHNVTPLTRPPLSSSEALSFPRQRVLTLHPGGKSQGGGLNGGVSPQDVSLQSILDAFLEHHPQADRGREEAGARLLAEAHPLDQVLGVLGALGAEVKSLALLAGAWMHYTELWHTRQSQMDQLSAFKEKAAQKVSRLRSLALQELKRQKGELNPDEELLLRILNRHDNPRLQLHWALCSPQHYPHLKSFFEVTAPLAKAPPRPSDRK